MATYSLDNFLGTPAPGETVLRIYDKTRKLRYEFNPNIAYFFTKSNLVIIRIEDKNDIYLDFTNTLEAATAASRLNDAKKDMTTPDVPIGTGSLSDAEQRKLAYFHALSKSMTIDNQQITEPKYKSAHNVKVSELWGTDILPCYTYNDAVAQSLVNSGITLHNQVILTKVPDSNGQSWYFNDSGRFVKPWIGPQDVPFPLTNLPSDGFNVILYRGDDATKGVPGSVINSTIGAWSPEYYAGIIHFGLGNTPHDLGWGTIKATFFEYTGVFGVPGVSNSFTTVVFNSGTSTLTFNSGTTYEESVVITGTGGGESSSITIEDEYNEVLSGVTVINFVGVDVRAQSSISGTTRRVNVYIPAPSYVSHFNTTDGTTTATVPSISTTNRYVALPTSEGNPYKIGNWTGGTTHPTIRSSVSTLSYSCINFSIYNLLTAFSVIVYDADGTTSIASHTIININGNSTQSSNNITITVSGWAPDTDRYKASINVSIGIGSILPSGGRFSIRLAHSNGSDGTYIFTQNNIFRDSESLNISIPGTLTILPEVPVIKQISGVYSYTIGSQWHVNLPSINNLNSISYPTTQQLRIENTNLFINTVINVNGEGGIYDIFGASWNRQFNVSNTEYDKLDWTTDLPNNTNWNHTTGTINTNFGTATAYDWTSISPITSVYYNYLIDTLTDLSDRNSEMFRSETLRLQSNLSTPWDSTVNLSTTDGLQVLSDRLVYPKYNFTAYLPIGTTTQPNYSGLNGTKYYYRTFTTNGFDVSNGRILFSDYNITEADLSSNDVRFDISINSGVSWYSLNSQYIGGVLSNGSGCRVDSAEYGLGVGTINSSSLKFTLGSGGFSKYINLRITFTNSASSKYIGGIDLTDNNWI
jgi:hypothetical protein